jgi:long-chain acyl-CoA synthetase
MHLSRLFERAVGRHPDRPALSTGIGAPATYRALHDRVARLAGWLRADLGIRPGARVTLVLPNSAAYAQAKLAIWHAGLVAVPVNSKLHPLELEYVLRDSGSALCLSTGELHRALEPVAARIEGLKLADVAGERYRDAAQAQPLPPHDGDGGDIAWLFYTSGTTGRPKGVMLTHDNLVSMALNFYADVQGVTADDVLIHAAPMSHGSGLYAVPWLIQGGHQVIPESGGFDEAELFDLLDHYASASLFAAPTMIHRMVRFAREHRRKAAGLRTIVAGGAPFYVEDIKSAVDCLGPRIAQIYGQGETPMTITSLSAPRIAEAVARGDDALLASVGSHFTAVEVAILDDDNRPLTAGTIGEVAVRGATVMKGYWNNPDATRQTIVDGWLHTGDVGVLDERGLLQLRDRSKDVIISGGSNIYPREVEEVLLRHGAVREVSVIGVADPEWGESVAAFVVLHPDAEATKGDLDALCLESIARFKRPKHYFFVDELPKNSTGKVLKTELRKRAKKN